MRKLIYSAMALILTVAPLFAASKTLVLEGSTTVLPIAQSAAESFMDANADAKITVRGGGSGVGITSFIEGTCDIADASRAMKPEELQKAAAKGKDAKANVIAMDGICVIVNTENSITALTKKQVQDIYTGAVSNWSEVGGKDEKIVVLSRDSASGTFEAFGALALGGQKVRADALMQASNQAIASTVTRTPGAIGYVGLGYASEGVKTVTIEGVNASKATVLSGKYPYSRALYMYTNGKPQGDVKKFIDFVLSSAGQKLVEKEGFVGLK
jgi:phosphate transport system substrate-binding protein